MISRFYATTNNILDVSVAADICPLDDSVTTVSSLAVDCTYTNLAHVPARITSCSYLRWRWGYKLNFGKGIVFQSSCFHVVLSPLKDGANTLIIKSTELHAHIPLEWCCHLNSSGFHRLKSSTLHCLLRDVAIDDKIDKRFRSVVHRTYGMHKGNLKRVGGEEIEWASLK